MPREDYGMVFYILKAGEVRYELEGTDITEPAKVGAPLGLLSIFGAKPAKLRTVAVSDCELVAIDKERFAFLLDETPNFARDFIQFLACEIAELIAIVEKTSALAKKD